MKVNFNHPAMKADILKDSLISIGDMIYFLNGEKRTRQRWLDKEREKLAALKEDHDPQTKKAIESEIIHWQAQIYMIESVQQHITFRLANTICEA